MFGHFYRLIFTFVLLLSVGNPLLAQVNSQFSSRVACLPFRRCNMKRIVFLVFVLLLMVPIVAAQVGGAGVAHDFECRANSTSGEAVAQMMVKAGPAPRKIVGYKWRKVPSTPAWASANIHTNSTKITIKIHYPVGSGSTVIGSNTCTAP